MRDPTRLLSEHGGADGLERELLESLRAAAPPESAHSEMWASLASQLTALGIAAGASSAASGAAASAAAGKTASIGAASSQAFVGAGSSTFAGALSALVPKTLVAKLLLAGALATVGGSAVLLQRHPAPPTQKAASVAVEKRATTSAPVHSRVPKPASVLPAEVQQRAPLAKADPGRVSPLRPSKAPKRAGMDALARESDLLSSARAALRAGDLATAGRYLGRLASEFKHGELCQESEVLRIELLAAQGERAEAARRARLFTEAHPESPHSEKLRRFIR